ncbi:MAG: peptide deformylase [Chloroflexota bacterium]
MAVRDIVTLGAPVLRQKAKKVRRVDAYVRQLVDDLIDTVHAANGAGLAAPQIGVPLRAIVTHVDEQLHVVLNPEFVSQSDEEVEGEEGCLSIPGWYGPVKRKERVTVRGLSRTGKPIKIKAEGWEARAFQHELDHLDGVLFTDRMEDTSLLHRAESREEEEELEDEQVFA